MLVTERSVLCVNSLSSWSLDFTTCRARSIGIDVNKEMTSNYTIISSSAICCFLTILPSPSEHDQTKKQIQDKLYNQLHSTDGTPARFYGMPKANKANVPLRPITSCISFPTYELSKHLVTIMSSLLNNKYTVKNSSIFSSKVRKQHIAEDEIMVSFDVISLFTSIPIDLALQVVKSRLQEHRLLTHGTDISVTNTSRLLEFVLNNSYFTHENENYQQISGCAMGSPISATIADIVMEHVEEVALLSIPHPRRRWFRYCDDSHSCLKKAPVD